MIFSLSKINTGTILSIDMYVLVFIIIIGNINLIAGFLIKKLMLPKFDAAFRDQMRFYLWEGPPDRIKWYTMGLATAIIPKQGKKNLALRINKKYPCDFKSIANRFDIIASYVSLVSIYIFMAGLLLLSIQYPIYWLYHWLR